MKIVFMGTPDFSVPSLKALDDRYGVSLVITQPDKEKGRGKKIIHSPVKEEALKRGIRVLQPVKIKADAEVIEEIRKEEPDFIVVVAYGQILSEEILAIPRFGCINLHASLLPELRGAAPINWAIIRGNRQAGNTTMLMEKGLDSGPMLLKDILGIHDKMTAGELHDLLSERGGDLLIRTLEGLAEGTLKPEVQDHERSTYAPMLTKETGNIDWTKSAEEVLNLIRGLAPAPAAYTYIGDDQVKVLEAEIVPKGDVRPGAILDVSKAGILAGTGKGALLLTKIQYPGKKPMLLRDFLNGNKITENEFNGGR
ncbi:MAG TPA: methionyl-tRNA formyltransferase [Clostridiaceae bacterium]|nr:methionyl-tRNA formyltransferase [Clostridiaceae bacterium]